MIYTNPRGIQNRYQETGDKWVESLKHPQVKTYYDYFKNNQTLQYDLPEIKTQKQEMHVKKIMHSYKPGLGMLNDYFKFSRPKRSDDHELTRDISELTFVKFIQQGRQQLTAIHRVTYSALGFIIWCIILYFIFIHGKQLPKNERVRVLNSQVLETYHFESQQTAIQKIIQRIQMVNDEYEKRLAQAKNKK